MAIVYCATNSVNGKRYFGITSLRLKKRWGKHRQAARSTHPRRSLCSALHSAIRKYGIDAFVVTVVHEGVDWAEACALEKSLIAQHGTRAPNGYNLTDGGDGCVGMRHSDATKKKLSRYRRKHTDETRKAMSDMVRERMALPENRERIRQALTGRKRSEEARTRDSVAAKARWSVPGYKEKIIKARKGLRFTGTHLANMRAAFKSPERSAKLSAAFKGKKHAPERVAKLRGRKRTPEQCARIAAGTIAAYERRKTQGHDAGPS